MYCHQDWLLLTLTLCTSGFSNLKLFFSRLTILFGQKPLCTAWLTGCRLLCHLLETKFLLQLVGILLFGRFVSLLGPTCLFISILTHDFYTLGYNPTRLNFVVQTVQFWLLESLMLGSEVLLWHCPCSFIPFSLFLIFWAFPYFLALQDDPGSSGVFPAPGPSISHFSKELWLLLLKMSMRNQDLGTRCVGYTCRLWFWISS